MGVNPADFEFLRGFVREHSAIQLEPGKEYLADCRLTPVAQSMGLKEIGELVTLLRNRPDEPLRQRVIEAMTTNETSFFRDIHPFETLRTVVIPQLIAARAAERNLTIWCAASSSGQEPHTIAMLLREHFPQLSSWKVRIVATDVSREMLRRTNNGIYTQLEVNRGLPARLLVRFFDKHGADWQIKKELRDMIEPRELNLARPWAGLPLFDVVFIRNVLIYFDQATKVNILSRVCERMRPDGYLFMGGAETTMGMDLKLKRESLGPSWCYRKAA